MKLKARFLPCSILLAVMIAAPHTHAQPPIPPIGYTIQEGDSLWVIATLYYNAPTAGGALYSVNQAVLDAANKNHPKEPKWIFPGTIIDLPAQIRSRGILYTRRESPMNRTLALAVGSPEGIDMTDLARITRDKILPKYVKPTGNVPSPLPKHVPVSQGLKATRESVPNWYQSPNTHLEVCAKSICTHFEQLCFFECLAMAKRVWDGDMKQVCDALQGNPRSTSVQLPYEIDEETRQDCAELIQ